MPSNVFSIGMKVRLVRFPTADMPAISDVPPFRVEDRMFFMNQAGVTADLVRGSTGIITDCHDNAASVQFDESGDGIYVPYECLKAVT